MRIVPALMLCLAGCSQSNDVYEELPNSSLAGAPREVVPDSRIESTLARPVTIGEDGPRLDACGAMGQVTRVGADGLATLGEGARLHICTRSIDQKWLGVVVAPMPAADNATEGPACGVSSPVERKQAYEGPCASGWVASAYVRLIAG